MQTLRLYDPARRAAWTDSLRPGQIVAFAKRIDTGMPCRPDGEPFEKEESVTCVVFDAVDEARDWCEARVQSAPLARFDVFGHDGRAQPPLLTIVHPSRRESLDGSESDLRRRTRIAVALVAGGVPLMLFAYSISGDRDPILPGFIGLNMVLIALRLLWMNLASREAERDRRDRLADYPACRTDLRAETGSATVEAARSEGDANEPGRAGPTP
jgi:hypothetical protein